MVKFEKSILVGAPVERVWEYLADHTHLPEIWPSLWEIKDLKKLPTGYTFKYAYKMAGMRFEGTCEDVEFLTKDRIVTKIMGGIEGTITLRFEPMGTQTRVYFMPEYKIPTTLLAKYPEPMFLKFGEHEALFLLENLKMFLEAPVPAHR